MKFGFAYLTGFLIATSAWAGDDGDALQWLQRAALSARNLNYSGTFVYQCCQHAESSRISHAVDGDVDMEYIEMLDGSPREVVRIGDEIKTWLPETQRLVIEKRVPRLHFPAVLPTGIDDLTNYYTIRCGVPGRVAGLSAQPIVFEPRDKLRFRRQLWIDRKTGLLLKSEIFSENGQPRESSAFTQLHVGAAVNRDAIKLRFNRQEKGWRVLDVRAEVNPSDNRPWEFHALLPGFRQVDKVIRKLQPGLPEGSQRVFSDGLAAISVFIEPLAADAPPPAVGQFTMGALNVYKRLAGQHLLVLMGDVPESALKKFGDGIVAR